MAEIINPIKNKTFVNSDLDVNFTYVWNHELNNSNIQLSWIDELGIQRNAEDVFTIIDENNISICTGGPIEGTHNIILVYDNNAQITGTKIFGLPLQEDASNDYRLVIGKDGFPSRNITIGSINDTIATEMNDVFLKTENCLSEIGSVLNGAQLARQSLNVLSIDQNDNRYITKSSGFSTGTMAQINTWIPNGYEPSGDFNLATKKYVDDGETKFNLTLDTSGKNSNITIYPDNTIFKKYGRTGGTYNFIYSGNMYFKSDIRVDSPNWIYFGKVSNYNSSITRYFSGYDMTSSNYQGCVGKIEGDGKIYVRPGKAGLTYTMDFCFIV